MRVGSRPPRGTHDRPPGRPDGGLEVFPTGATLARLAVETFHNDGAPPGTDGAGSSGPVHDPPCDPHERAGFHARPGHRPGGVPSARSGGGGDVVRPLLVAPALASRIIADGLALPLPHLLVLGGDDRFLVWSVSVVARRERPVPATLHLLGSPSMVVTVLELVPSRKLRWGRERFVRRGVEAMDVLARRIELAAA